MKALAETARWSAAWRERESLRPDKLFDDPLAGLLAGADGRRMLDLSGADPRVGAHLAIRTRFCDDRVHLAKQVVSVAAGMDARAFRIDWRPGVRFFEFDRQEVMELKLGVLGQQKAAPRCQWEPFAADVCGDWPAILAAKGFDAGQPSVWILEGILQYLSETEVRSTLARITALCAPESTLCADLPSASYFESPWTRPALEICAQRGMAWQFGTDHPETLLADFGWQAQVYQLGEDGACYGRWKDRVYERNLTEIPRFFLVSASSREKSGDTAALVESEGFRTPARYVPGFPFSDPASLDRDC